DSRKKEQGLQQAVADAQNEVNTRQNALDKVSADPMATEAVKQKAKSDRDDAINKLGDAQKVLRFSQDTIRGHNQSLRELQLAEIEQEKVKQRETDTNTAFNKATAKLEEMKDKSNKLDEELQRARQDEIRTKEEMDKAQA